MLDLFDEFRAVVSALGAQKIDYAVCGGLAMAIHAFPRATVDIDLLIRPADLGAVTTVARSLGYTLEAKPMTFKEGDVEIRRISKPDPELGDVLVLDLLLVTPATEEVWRTRVEVAWEHGTVWVVSRRGLVTLKSLRGSGQDLDDIEVLEDGDEG